jgi:hypothetical protein
MDLVKSTTKSLSLVQLFSAFYFLAHGIGVERHFAILDIHHDTSGVGSVSCLSMGFDSMAKEFSTFTTKVMDGLVLQLNLKWTLLGLC